MRRSLLVAAVVVAQLIVLIPAGPGQAATGVAVNLSASAVRRGYTVAAAGGAVRFGVLGNAFAQPVRVMLVPITDEAPALPEHVIAVSERWSYDVISTNPVALATPLRLQFQYSSQTQRPRALYLLRDGVWKKLVSSSDRPARHVVTASLRTLSGQLVVGEDDRSYVGVASWYRSSKYPYGAANNELPMQSRARVTNLETGKSVIVTIVSRGPYVEGRVIDLSATAFQAIAPRGAGLARVRVQALDGAQEPEQKPGPTIAAAAAVVYNPTSGVVVWGKRASTPRSIASLTKLVTGLVVQATEPDYRALVTMAASDIPAPEPGVRIRVATGQTITVRDLFYSMVTGSANNATLALARSTGVPPADFVDRLNALAQSHGWSSMHLDDPTGLAVGNVASATDVAKLAATAFQDNLIRKAGARRTFSYTVGSTSEQRTIKHPAYLYNHVLDQAAILAAKTGFINESAHNIALLAKGVSGQQFVVVVLGSPTTTTRSRDAKTLIDWAAPQF